MVSWVLRYMTWQRVLNATGQGSNIEVTCLLIVILEEAFHSAFMRSVNSADSSGRADLALGGVLWLPWCNHMP